MSSFNKRKRDTRIPFRPQQRNDDMKNDSNRTHHRAPPERIAKAPIATNPVKASIYLWVQLVTYFNMIVKIDQTHTVPFTRTDGSAVVAHLAESTYNRKFLVTRCYALMTALGLPTHPQVLTLLPFSIKEMLTLAPGRIVIFYDVPTMTLVLKRFKNWLWTTFLVKQNALLSFEKTLPTVFLHQGFKSRSLFNFKFALNAHCEFTHNAAMFKAGESSDNTPHFRTVPSLGLLYYKTTTSTNPLPKTKNVTPPKLNSTKPPVATAASSPLEETNESICDGTPIDMDG